MEEKFAQLQAKIEADNSLVEKLLAQENANEVQDLLKAQGFDFSLEEIDMIKKGVIKAVQQTNGELSDTDLEDVAGGFAITAAGVLAAAGLITAIGGGITALAGGISSAVRDRW